MKEKKICGIYKITSPSGKVYVGESIDIKSRWKEYNRFDCKNQRKLYNSFKKYSVENHIFEILEECIFDELLCKERYWQDFYDVLNGGLNCLLTNCGDKKQVLSKETLIKMAEAQRGEKNHMFGKRKELNPNYGKSLPEETKKKMRKKKTYKTLHPNSKLILDTQTGVFFNSIKEASEAYNIVFSTLRNMLNKNNSLVNKTNLIICK